MGGDDSTTTTSGLNNKNLNTAVSTIGSKLNTAIGQGVKPYGSSLYPGLSSQTTQGVNSLMGAAGNAGGLNTANDWARGAVNSGGYNSALSGAQSGIQGFLQESAADAPGYASLRAKAGDDTLRDVNSIFTASGRFGSGSHVDQATESLGNVYAAMDMQNHENRLGRQLAGNQALAGIGQTAFGNAAGAAGMMPGLYQAGLMPGQAMLSAGQVMDADALARRQGEADLFDRTQNAQWNTLGRASQVLAGTAPSAGTTTTQTQNVPWWQTGLGIGAGLMSFL